MAHKSIIEDGGGSTITFSAAFKKEMASFLRKYDDTGKHLTFFEEEEIEDEVWLAIITGH